MFDGVAVLPLDVEGLDDVPDDDCCPPTALFSKSVANVLCWDDVEDGHDLAVDLVGRDALGLRAL